MTKRKTKVSIIRGVPEHFEFEGNENLRRVLESGKKDFVVEKIRKLEEKNIVVDKANQELLERISELGIENKRLKQEVLSRQEIIERNKEHYNAMFRIIKLEEKDRIDKLIQTGVEKEMMLSAEINQLKETVIRQKKVLEEKIGKQRDLLLLLNSKLKEIQA